MVLPRFVQQALAGEDLTVYGNGRQTRCFAHVHDTVRGDLLLLDHDGATATCSTSARDRDLDRRARAAGDRAHRLAFDDPLRPYEEAYGDGFEELGRRKPDTTTLRARRLGAIAHDGRRHRRHHPARAARLGRRVARSR